MAEAGIVEFSDNGIIPDDILLDDRIIVPYLDTKGQATLLRPHKLGLEGVEVQPYCPYLLKDMDTRQVVMTESEFKAAALFQWGIAAIGIPGIASFSGKHFSRLVELLKKHGIEEVVIIFDNEIKDDPRFPNFKEKPGKRYDTEFYAYIMAYKLSKQFDTRIGKLPAEWQENGKIDFDLALAQGRTSGQIRNIIRKAVSYTEYRNNFEGEAKRVLERKIERKFFRPNVERMHRKYKKPADYNDNGEVKSWQEVSNFILDIQASYKTEDGYIRQVIFTNRFGEKSEPFFIESNQMSSMQNFKDFCLAKGNFIWKGTMHDLMNVWEYELMRDSGNIIFLPEQIGEIEPGFWLFGNVAIKDGITYKPDDSGVFWIDGKGYQPQALETGQAGDTMMELMPTLYIEDDFEIKEAVEALKENLGCYDAYIGIGWAIASIFSREIYREFRGFPILFLHGKREAGKTTFMRWLMSFFGIETGGKSIAESTQNYIMRLLSYRSSIGAWFDEYRNDQKIIRKHGYLRSAYNRQSSGKGIKSSFGARGYDVNATLALSGEETPGDSGLYSRLIPLQLSENKRSNRKYEWIKNNEEKFSKLTYELIKKYDDYKGEIIENIKSTKKNLQAEGIPDRAAEVWGIPAACFLTIFHEDIEISIEEFEEWIKDKCIESRETSEEEHMLNIFWNDLVVLQSQGDINQDHVRAYNHNGKECLAIWYKASYQIWAKNYRQTHGQQPFDKSTIRKYIYEETYLIDKGYTVWLGYGDNKSRRKCYLIDHKDINAPEELQELYEAIKEEAGFDAGLDI